MVLSFFAALTFVIASLTPFVVPLEAPAITEREVSPLPTIQPVIEPALAAATTAATVAESATPDPSEYPVRLVIPSIGLDAPIEYVGVNAKGEMDVPAGNSGNVGWYKYGTVPGRVGSAVIDAHVYAAFANLKDVKVLGDVYVITAGGESLHFKVAERVVHRLSDMSAEHLFNRADTKRLNLITCAGQYISSMETYDHRLVLYAELVEEKVASGPSTLLRFQ